MRESEEWLNLEGRRVCVFYEGWGWHVWLEGAGDVGYSLLNREEAIEQAAAKLRETTKEG